LVEETFKAHVALQETLTRNGTTDLFTIPGGEKTTREIQIAGIDSCEFLLTYGLALKGKLDVSTVCPFELQEGFDLQESYAMSAALKTDFTTDFRATSIGTPVASGFAAVTKLGKGDVKFSVGPDLTFDLKIKTVGCDRLFEASADLGVLAFLDVGLNNTSPGF